MRAILIGILVLSTVAVSNANDRDPYCFERAGEAYGIPPLWLYTISRIESDHRADALNDNGTTFDYGHMQINSSWADDLGPERWQALGDPCYQTMVGAWIFSDCLRRYGPTWEGIGCYNAKSRAKREIYYWKFRKALDAILQEGQSKEDESARIAHLNGPSAVDTAAGCSGGQECPAGRRCADVQCPSAADRH